MAKQNQIRDLRNLNFNHKENLFDVRQDTEGQFYYDLSDTIYIEEGTISPIDYTSHEITDKDTLFSLSQKYYNTKHWWWVLGVVNNIDNPFTLRERVGEELKILKKTIVGEILSGIRE